MITAISFVAARFIGLNHKVRGRRLGTPLLALTAASIPNYRTKPRLFGAAFFAATAERFGSGARGSLNHSAKSSAGQF
jgi:hypothetical protein